MSKKIPVSSPQAPLQNPFSALQPESFPEAPPAEAEPKPEAEAAAKPAKRPRVVLRREKAQRGGKTVIVISQLPTHLSPAELENLCRKARKALGCGGVLSGREIELQGDQADRVRSFLEREGFAPVGPG